MAAAPAAEPAQTLAGLDPITFEVIRHRLWAINDDQARMAARLSGSFIVYEGYDFNAALVTADGRSARRAHAVASPKATSSRIGSSRCTTSAAKALAQPGQLYSRST